jgi:glycosyltransferase involved in cell wall biosynthesis
VVRLLYAGTWLDQRGIFYIRDALRGLASHLPFTMTFAGPGIPAEEIYSFFGEGLRPRIQVREAVRADLMQELYAEHDIFVFPSLMEGLPNVLLEAMAGGMPVITTETCGMPDVVENEFNGLLIPPADATALQQAIARLTGCAALRANLGRAAQQTMRRYTWECSGSLMEKLLIETIAHENISDE